MLTQIQLLLSLLGSLTLRVFAEEAGTVLMEDETPTADPGDGHNPELSEAPTLLSMITGSIPFEELMTTDSAGGDSENATEPTVPGMSEDGLETVTLVGIILGIIVAIGVATAIILIVVKRVSGRR